MKPVEPVVLSRSDMSIVKASVARKLTSYNKKCSGAANESGLCVTLGSSRICLFCYEQIHAVNHVYVYTLELVCKDPLNHVDAVVEGLGSNLGYGRRLVFTGAGPEKANASEYEADEWFE